MVSVPARRGQVVYATAACRNGGLARWSKSDGLPCSIDRGRRSRTRRRSHGCRSFRRSIRALATGACASFCRDGFPMSPGRAHRLWRRRNSRCRASAGESVLRPAATTKTPAGEPGMGYDFVFDACANGRRLKCLTVTDEFTKEACDRCRRSHPLGARDRGAFPAGERARRSQASALRQRPGVRVARVAQMDRRSGHRHGVDRTRQALAEWRERKLQRQVPR